MINIKSITVKNFMSVGNQTQAVDFDRDPLTLVLGANLDLGGDDTGSRNGTGKTTILNSLSYALYGQALTNIKKENLINKINGKHMLVTVGFEKDGIVYRIERGRKPNILKLFINNKEQENSEEDDAQGDSRETQHFIEQCLGMSHTMFKHLVALNTYTEPFLSMKAADQREVIEQLLGITVLSEKAEQLKLQLKDSKDQLSTEQVRIDAVKAANANIQKSIDSLKLKSSAWNDKQIKDVESLVEAINELEGLDIDKELAAHKTLSQWNNQTTVLKDLTKEKSSFESAVGQAEKLTRKYHLEIDALKTKICPQCEQSLHDHKHQELANSAEKNWKDSKEYLDNINTNISLLENKIEKLKKDLVTKPDVFYDREADALNHQNQVNMLNKQLDEKAEAKNPYDEQIEELKNTALQEIDYSKINDLTVLKEHQDFLLKLLTNKDSFIRKKIIDQNLAYLNRRLSHYIDALGLPHLISFQNDLTVSITNFGQDLDFDNLSRGERNRLILSMSFAFRDVWESLYQNINLLFIDELIDSGMDTAGVESGLGVLKKMARERNKNIYLISHKEELVGRVNNVLRVVKESGFTSYSNSAEYIEV